MGFEEAWRFSSKWEGVLSDDKYDRGGITKYGMSLVNLTDLSHRHPGWVLAAGIALPVTKDTVRRLTFEQVTGLFRQEFWEAMELGTYPELLGLVTFDCAVNSGCKEAAMQVQRVCNRMLSTGLSLDGKVGPLTRRTMERLVGAFSWNEVLDAFVRERCRHYRAIVATRPSQKCFLPGWLNRANDMGREFRR